MLQDTTFLIRCHNLASHFNNVKEDLIEPENALHERLLHLSNAFLTPEIVSTLERIIRAELHDLQAAQVHILAAQTLPLLFEINETFYGARWSDEDIVAAQRYLFSVADKLLFESSTKRVTASEFIREHLAELNSAIKNCPNKKKFLVAFARKHGFEFDGTHLLRTLNEVNLPKKRGANRGAK